jgi:hypothetical protein
MYAVFETTFSFPVGPPEVQAWRTAALGMSGTYRVFHPEQEQRGRKL